MALNNNKPDLADLKARLGLNKNKGQVTDSEATEVKSPPPPPPGAASAAAMDENDDTRPINVRDDLSEVAADGGPAPGVSPGRPAPPYGPPSKSTMPPPPVSSPRVTRAVSPGKKAKPERRDTTVDLVDEVGEDISLPGARLFSNSVLVLLGIVMGVGLLFGYLTATSFHERHLYDGRTTDAAHIRDLMKPRVEAFLSANSTIQGLSATEVDFDAAKSLAELDIAVPGNIFAHYRVLLGAELVDLVTRYMVDAKILETLLSRHEQLTNRVEREAIELLLEENKVLEHDLFAVVFDFRDLIRRGGDDGYRPKTGRLVSLEGFERDDQGRVAVRYLNASRQDHTEIQGVVPISKSELLKSAGPANALERYGQRVAEIQEHAKKMEQYGDRVLKELSAVADRGAASLIHVSSPE